MFQFNDIKCTQRWWPKLRFFLGHLLDVACKDIILDCDFNLDLDVTVAKKGNNSTHDKSLEILGEFVTQLDLIDGES